MALRRTSSRSATDASAPVDDPQDGLTGELHADSGADLASALPESLTVTVALPELVQSVPAHEMALTIDQVTIDPGVVTPGPEIVTTSIAVITGPVVATPVEEPAGPVTPLPDPERVFSRRDRLSGKIAETPEPVTMLTDERLLGGGRTRKAAPEGAWPAFVYAITLHQVNIGDSKPIRERKALEARINRKFEGSTRFVPVLTRKGGVGKTTVTSLMGMAMADVRDDRVIAIDANPDRGTLAERVNKQTRSTVRDVVTRAGTITDFTDFSTLVSRDETRLDILASDADPLLSEAFDENDYNVVADLASRFYDIVLTDCGTGIVHSVMRATLQRADSIVIVSGGSIDEARLASETLTWLEANGYGDLVRNAVVALNTSTHGTNLVKLEEIEAHFKSRVRELVLIPYDPHLAAGSVIDYKALKPMTRNAARELAAIVVDGLPSSRTS